VKDQIVDLLDASVMKLFPLPVKQELVCTIFFVPLSKDPCTNRHPDAPLKALIFDSVFNSSGASSLIYVYSMALFIPTIM
jgi:hypothetical protein